MTLDVEFVPGQLLAVFGEARIGPPAGFAYFSDRGPGAGWHALLDGVTAEEAAQEDGGASIATEVQRLAFGLRATAAFLRGQWTPGGWGESWQPGPVDAGSPGCRCRTSSPSLRSGGSSHRGFAPRQARVPRWRTRRPGPYRLPSGRCEGAPGPSARRPLTGEFPVCYPAVSYRRTYRHGFGAPSTGPSAAGSRATVLVAGGAHGHRARRFGHPAPVAEATGRFLSRLVGGPGGVRRRLC